MTDKIKPCPWCRGENVRLDCGGNGRHGVDCWNRECLASGPDRRTVAEAIEAWNRLSELAGARLEKWSIINQCGGCLLLDDLQNECPLVDDMNLLSDKVHPDCPLRKGPVVLMLGVK